MQRFGQVIGIRAEQRPKEYIRNCTRMSGPACLKKIAECNIRNYSIYRYGDLLFAYMEYHGDDFRSRYGRHGRRRNHTEMVGSVHAHAGSQSMTAPRANGGRRLTRSSTPIDAADRGGFANHKHTKSAKI